MHLRLARTICRSEDTRVCLKNTVEVEKSRFWTLDKGAFEGNIGLYCPKKTCRTGFKSCLLSPISIFQTHSKAGTRRHKVWFALRTAIFTPSCLRAFASSCNLVVNQCSS
jgi:hypothetical protein